MTVVERHPIDTAVARERVSGLAESFESILPDVEDDASWLRTLLNIALTFSTVDATRDGTDSLPWWFFLALGVCLMSLLVDILYAFLDPRVKY